MYKVLNLALLKAHATGILNCYLLSVCLPANKTVLLIIFVVDCKRSERR